MHVRCWQCSEEIDTLSVELDIYDKIINSLRDKMCDNTINDECSFWWIHGDCNLLSQLIKELKCKL